MEEALCSTNKEEQEIDVLSEIMTKLEIDSSSVSEKLLNLHVLLMHLLAWDNDLEAMGTLDSSTASFQKALTFDLLCSILESELKEVNEVLDLLEAQIVDISYKISSKNGNHIVMEVKLSESAESLKQSRGQVSEITLKLAQLRRTLHYIRNEEFSEFSEHSQDLRQKYVRPSDSRHKNALNMLEKSLARELELEKKIMEFKLNEEQLKLKLHYTEEVASMMEEGSEFIWGQFLQAENSSEVFKNISKELVGHLQILQFSKNGSAHREIELKTNLEDLNIQLKAKELLVQDLETRIAESRETVSEVFNLRKLVKITEQKLKNTELEVKNVNISKQELLVHLAEMENANESLKESLFEAESRAENGETKIKELATANLELSEELNFLKDTDDKKTKKVNSLEKQVRELEVLLQNSKVSSEASQEQQNMLYSAIWDMETLIEDLKSKASKAESRIETVEEQCNKEVSILKERAKTLEAMLELANDEKERYAEEITTRNKLLMDMVMQIASERERIQEQLCSLVKENKTLRVNQCCNKYQRNGYYDGDKELSLHVDGHGIEAFAESLKEGKKIKEESENNYVSEKSSMNNEIRRVSSFRSIPVLSVAFMLFISFFVLAFGKEKQIFSLRI